MDSTERLKAALNIVRRVSPRHADSTIRALINLAPDLEDDLLQRIDCPLTVSQDDFGQAFVACEYNRDGNSYRSPHSNQYIPPLLSSEFFPSHWLRELEIHMNKLLVVYRDFYYGEKAVSSAYFWDTDDSSASNKSRSLEEDFYNKSFACAIVTKNTLKGVRRMDDQMMETGMETSGDWNSINIIQVEREAEGVFQYRCFTTVYIQMETKLDQENEHVIVNGYNTQEGALSGKIERRTAKSDHCVNLGKVMEETETQVRTSSLEIFISRMNKAVDCLMEKKANSTFKNKLADLHKEAQLAGKKKYNT